MRVTVLHRGVPIAAGHLAIDSRYAGGELTPVPAYEAIRPAVCDACRAVLNFGYLPPKPAVVGGVNAVGAAAGQEAIARAFAVSSELELRDERGGLIPTNWIDLIDDGEGSTISVMAEVSIAEATSPARIQPRPHGDADTSSPTA